MVLATMWVTFSLDGLTENLRDDDLLWLYEELGGQVPPGHPLPLGHSLSSWSPCSTYSTNVPATATASASTLQRSPVAAVAHDLSTTSTIRSFPGSDEQLSITSHK